MKIFKMMLATVITLFSFNTFALPITATTGSEFTIYYNGINGSPVGVVDGLTAEITYSDFSFVYGGDINDSGTGNTAVSFNYSIFNSSSSPVTDSRVSGMGFDTSPTVFDIAGTVDTGSVFDNVVIDPNASEPNGLGKIEFCFSDNTNNCNGGQSGGVTLGNTGTGGATVYFLGAIDEILFDRFTIRYQSLFCGTGDLSSCGTSASGTGADVSVPEPGVVALLAIGLLGMVAARRKKTV